MKRSRPIGVLSVFLLSVVFIAEAYSINNAESYVSAGANFNNSNLGPLNSGWSLYEEYYYSSGGTLPVNIQSNAYVKTTFDGVQIGPTTMLGEISGNGYAYMTGASGGAAAESGSSGAINFWYMPAQKKLFPFNVAIPVTLTAYGNVDVASSDVNYANGQASVGAFTNAPGFDVKEEYYTAKKQYEVGGAAFAYTTRLWLTPGVPQQFFMWGGGALQAHGWYEYGWAGGTPLGGSAEYSFFVDPTFGFDQEAFNALYGANAFALNDYYALQFSPNMTVTPIPSTVLLFGSGLAGLVGLGRWRLKK